MLQVKDKSATGAIIIGLFLLFVQMTLAQSLESGDASPQKTEKAIKELKQRGEYDSLMDAFKNVVKTNDFNDGGGVQNAVVQSAKLVGGERAKQFGTSISISGNTAIVGAPSEDVGENSLQGVVYIFVKSGTTWTQQARFIASDGTADDAFGISVAISGDTAIVGASLDDVGANENQGSAYIFTRSGTVWTQQAKFTASDGAAFDRFGRSAAIDGNTAIIGNLSVPQSLGAAYIFTRSGTTWSQQTKLTSPSGEQALYFGYSVSISGDTVIVGASGYTVGGNFSQGAAYIFTRSGTTWTQQAQLIASDGAAEDRFGISVAIKGDTAIAGAPEDDVGANRNQGSAYVFTRSGTTWTQQAKLTASDGVRGDFLGYGVAIDGERAVIGAYGVDVGEIGQGAAYIFTRSGTAWTQRGKFTGSDSVGGDNFGESVAIDGGNIIAGARSNGSGGAAYIFQISATVAGRVFTASGRGLPNAFVSISNQQGVIKTAMTNPFGYYRFKEIETSASYTVTVRSKSFQFAPQVVNVNDNITNLDFIPNQ